MAPQHGGFNPSESAALVDGATRRLLSGEAMSADGTGASTLGDSLGAVQTA